MGFGSQRGWRYKAAVAAGFASVAGAAGADEGALGFVKAGLPVRVGMGMGAFRLGLGGCRQILPCLGEKTRWIGAKA